MISSNGQATYTISLLANHAGEKFDLEKIWQQQDISSQLKQQIQTLAVEVDRVLHHSAEGKMVSEWAKKQECWEAVKAAKYTLLAQGIPEIR